MGDPEPQGGVETLDVLCSTNNVQRTENNTFVGTQAIGMTHGIQVGRGQASPQTESSNGISVSDEAADDPFG
ncbi:MAG: hypothetical protein JWQ08_2509 [Deinococcus sp.]|nr:hypothetical protein [Deinococcus sp.]